MFVWHDLFTTDPERADAFYTELFGWRVEYLDMGAHGEYRRLSLAGVPLGGIAPGPPGAPSMWLSVLAQKDVDAAVVRSQELGAKVWMAPDTIPEVGRFAILSDPGGAPIGYFASVRPPRPVKPRPDPGEWCWHELYADDVEGAKSFYAEVAGWTFEEGPMPDYWLANRGAERRGGIMANPARAAGVLPHWLAYVAVKDLDEAHRRAQSLGGREVNPIHEIPLVGRFAILADPTGATFALFEGG